MGDPHTADWPAPLRGVEVHEGVVPAFAEPAADGVLWQVGQGRFRLEVPGVARFLVEDGRRVTVERDAPWETVDRYLRTTPAAALLYQRGMVALHAAAVARDGEAVVFGGDSASGKSTLAAAMAERGWEVLADEVTAVDVEGNGRPRIHPMFPDIVLWPDAAGKLGLNPEGPASGPVVLRPSRVASGAVPVRHVWVLATHTSDALEVTEPSGAARFRAVTGMLYNTHVAEALCPRETHFRAAAAVCAHARVRSIVRPQHRWTVDELAGLIDGGRR